jgi:hypothetical protein
MPVSCDAKNAKAIDRGVAAGGAQLSVLPPQIFQALNARSRTGSARRRPKTSSSSEFLDFSTTGSWHAEQQRRFGSADTRAELAVYGT